MFKIVNDGQRIAESNYFDSDHASQGYCFLSWNAGAARLLLPDSMAHALRDMATAKVVIVSRGPWVTQGGRGAIELLFEDQSDSPYCLTLLLEQTDRALPENDQGGGVVVTVWTRDGERLRKDGKYREVGAIPCLEPWVVN